MKYSKITKKETALTFRKWRNKNYSLFNTLNKVVRIAVLSLAYFIVVPIPVFCHEQDTSEVKMEYDLDEIEVNAKRTPALYSEVARIIAVIEKQEIELSQAESVQDVLEYISGVDIRQRGGEGVQADISIRGGTFDQTLILLNGINITDPQTGHHNLNLPISLEQVERIEILEGPAARVYGPNAFSGAINIITETPGNKELNLKISGGSFDYFNSSISSGFETGKLEHLLAAGRKSSGGYTENTDFKIYNLFYANRFLTEKGTLSFQAGFSGKAFGANSFYTPRFPEQFEQTETLFSSVKWESNSMLHFSPLIYWRNHKDRFELFRNEAPAWYSSHNYHQTDVYGAGMNSWFQWELGKTAFGAEFRNEAILSNVLGEELNARKKVPGEEAYYTKSKSRNIVAFFAEHAWYKTNWTVTTGFMANHISEAENAIHIFPGAEISYNIYPSAKIFVSYNTSLRMPTFTDLYYEGPTNIGNPELLPEESSTFEGGLKWNGRIIQADWVIFNRRGKNIIDWVKTADDEVWQPQNLTRLKSLGAQINIQLFFGKYIDRNLSDKITVSYFYNNLEKETTNFISNYVLDNLKHKLIISVDKEILSDFKFTIKSVYQDREGTFTLYTDGNWAEETPYRPFWQFDLNLKYQKRNFGVYAGAKNIFNKQYFDIGNVIQPGRWIKAGVTYNVNFE